MAALITGRSRFRVRRRPAFCEDFNAFRRWAADLASVSKIFGTELQRQMGITGLRVLGLPGMLEPGSNYAPLQGRVERWAMAAPSYTIAGGTSEVNRNIVATRGLGLPRN